VVFGAGDLSTAHSDEEWIAEEDLRRLTDLLSTLIEEWPGRARAF
jgi:acetylornithine deacetylase/succinyl-diaminopimelate desuccinylase-like protein